MIKSSPKEIVEEDVEMQSPPIIKNEMPCPENCAVCATDGMCSECEEKYELKDEICKLKCLENCEKCS